MARGRKKRQVRQENIGPTPETKDKLKADVMRRLFRQGKITQIQYDAAEEIVDVWQGLTVAMFPKPSDGTPHGGGLVRFISGQPTANDIFDRLPDRIAEIWRDHYRPWANRMNLPAGSTTVLDLTLSIVADNMGVHKAEKHFRLRNGAAVIIVANALDEYARIAGWKMAA